nr:DUF6119 family protein [Paenibacillus xylanexedens]
MRLTYYLFNENVKGFNQLILSKKVNEENNYFELEAISESCEFEFKVFIQRNKSNEPKWITFLEKDLDIPNREEIKNTVNSFVILLKIMKNEIPYYFAITGGLGFTAINKNNLESNFGLKVALNSIDAKELKAFDVRNIDLKTRQKRVLFNKGSEVGEFDLNFEQDLINLVSGKSRNQEFGSSVRGSTSSLNLNSDVTFSKLGYKCSQILELFLSENYKENFGFIDNIRIMKDPEIVTELNQNLFNAILERNKDNLSLAYPDMIEYENCSSYLIRRGHKKQRTSEISLEDLFSLLDEDVPFNNPKDIEKIKITGFDDSNTPITSSVSLNHFVIYQTEYNQSTYIFSLNNWYKIDNNYFERVQSEMMEIPVIEKKGFLTDIEVNESEGDYNERQDQNYFLCLDKRNFQIANSMSKIEVCDLLSKDKHFVCVKKGTRSATLSHLFAQGSVSMALLKDSAEYRSFVIRQVEDNFPTQIFNEDEFPFNECTLVYAISSENSDDLRTALPFFSKVNILHHYNLIRRLGITVALYRIPIR